MIDCYRDIEQTLIFGKLEFIPKIMKIPSVYKPAQHPKFVLDAFLLRTI